MVFFLRGCFVFKKQVIGMALHQPVAKVVQILAQYGHKYIAYNVLQDPLAAPLSSIPVIRSIVVKPLRLDFTTARMLGCIEF